MKNYWLKPKSYQEDWGGEANLGIFYSPQYVENELISCGCEEFTNYRYQLARIPVLPATLTGIICIENKPIQTFFVNSSGLFSFKKTEGSCQYYVWRGVLTLSTGQLFLNWNTIPPNHKLVIGYEYERMFKV